MKKPKAKKATKKSKPKVTTKAKSNAAFFVATKRGTRGLERKPLHVLLTLEERNILVGLSNKWKMSAADVVRTLLVKA